MTKKKNIMKTMLLFMISVMFLQACEESNIDPFIDGIAIENADLIQVEDGAPYVPVSFTARSGNLSSVTVQFTQEDGTASFSNTLKQITSDNLNRVKMNVPFPTPDVAPSGKYSVKLFIGESANGSAEASYSVNVLNNRTIKYCDFPAAPAGKIGVFVTIPGGDALEAAGKSVYIVGNFMVKNGADGDWNAGNPNFKLTKLGNQCYYIFLDKFDKDDEFKFTMGTWDEEFLGAKGEGLGNQKASGGNVNLTVYNFKTLPVTQYQIPEVLPSSAIQTGKMTAIFDVGTYDAGAKYYLVQKGATSLDGAPEMTQVAGTNKVAGAVTKNSAAEYIVVKNEIANAGVNAYGYSQVVKWDGNTNPVTNSVRTFSTTPEITFADVFMVGGATPGGWNNPVPVPDQQFTKTSDGVYTLTVALTSGQGYLLLPVNGSWDNKWGTGTGGKLSGDLRWAGGDFSSPDESGTYKVTLDFTKGAYGTYTLVKQ